MCGFSGNTIKILNAYGAKYGSRDVLQDPALREGIKAFTQWPTIPQVRRFSACHSTCAALWPWLHTRRLARLRLLQPRRLISHLRVDGVAALAGDLRCLLTASLWAALTSCTACIRAET